VWRAIIDSSLVENTHGAGAVDGGARCDGQLFFCAVTEIFLGCDSGVFGTISVSTPSFSSARM